MLDFQLLLWMLAPAMAVSASVSREVGEPNCGARHVLEREFRRRQPILPTSAT